MNKRLLFAFVVGAAVAGLAVRWGRTVDRQPPADDDEFPGTVLPPEWSRSLAPAVPGSDRPSPIPGEANGSPGGVGVTATLALLGGGAACAAVLYGLSVVLYDQGLSPIGAVVRIATVIAVCGLIAWAGALAVRVALPAKHRADGGPRDAGRRPDALPLL